MWAIPGSLALIIVAVLAKDRFVPPPINQPFSFRAYDSGQTADIAWDLKSPSIQSARSAALDIKDGGETRHYSLTPEQLRAGKMTYVRHSADLELRMTVYLAQGASLQEYARLVGAATNDQSGSSEVTQLRADRARLEAEAKTLREELRKERLRADQMQEAARILQNRIAVDAARGQGPDAKKQ
jgi:hypothetical protein